MQKAKKLNSWRMLWLRSQLTIWKTLPLVLWRKIAHSTLNAELLKVYSGIGRKGMVTLPKYKPSFTLSLTISLPPSNPPMAEDFCISAAVHPCQSQNTMADSQGAKVFWVKVPKEPFLAVAGVRIHVFKDIKWNHGTASTCRFIASFSISGICVCFTHVCLSPAVQFAIL